MNLAYSHFHQLININSTLSDVFGMFQGYWQHKIIWIWCFAMTKMLEFGNISDKSESDARSLQNRFFHFLTYKNIPRVHHTSCESKVSSAKHFQKKDLLPLKFIKTSELLSCALFTALSYQKWVNSNLNTDHHLEILENRRFKVSIRRLSRLNRKWKWSRDGKWRWTH